MKTIVIAFILVIMICSTARAEMLEMSLFPYHLGKLNEQIKKAGVRSVSVYSDASETAKRQRSTYYEYDDAGNRIMQIDYNHKGKILGVHKRKYDGNGRLIEKTSYMASGALKSRDIYEYGPDGAESYHANFIGDGAKPVMWCRTKDSGAFGSKVEESWSAELGLSSSVKSMAGGKLIKTSWTDSDGKTRESVFEYRPDGQIARNVIYSSEKKIVGESVNLYDEKGNMTGIDETPVPGSEIKNITKTAALNLAAKLRYLYDKNNNIVEMNFFSSDGQTHRTLYSYDERGLVIGITKYDPGEKNVRKEAVLYKSRPDITATAESRKPAPGSDSEMAECYDNCAVLAIAASSVKGYSGKTPASVKDIVKTGILSTGLKCPCGGKYVFGGVDYTGFIEVKCSVHGVR